MDRIDGTNHVAGMKQSKKAIAAGRVKIAYLAQDADPWIFESFLTFCRAHGVEVIEVPTMKELARGCRVEVPTAVACICEE